MGTRNRKKQKSYSPWRYLNGRPGYVDIHGGQREPTKQELMGAYEDVVFACVNYISDIVAATTIRLYGQDTNKPESKAKTLSKLELSILKKSGVSGFRIRKAQTVQEVTDHGILDLLDRPNPNQNWTEFIKLICSYEDVAGQTFVHVSYNGLYPAELTILPSHLVTVLPGDDDGLGLQFDYFPVSSTSEKTVYREKDDTGRIIILHFKFPDLFNPYLDGLSPVRSVWERQLIGKKELSYLSNTFSNQARMDVVVAPEERMGQYEATRLSTELTQRYRGAGAGGIFVPPEKMTVYPLQFPPKDLAGLSVYQVIKTCVCNAFKFPPVLLDLAGTANRSETDSAIYALTRFAIVPRLVKIAAKLNELVVMFDPRLWLEFDSPVPEDEQLTLQKRQQELAENNMMAITGNALPNETRAKYGYAETDWGTVPLMMANMVPRETAVADEPTAEPTAVAVKPSAAEVGQLQKDVYAGLIPREAGIQTLVVSMGLSPETAAALLPEIKPVNSVAAPEPPEPPKGSTPAPSPESPPAAKPEPTDGKAADNVPDAGQLEDKGADKAQQLEDKATEQGKPLNVPEQSASKKNLQKKIVKVLHKYFRQQRGVILDRLKSLDLAQIKTKAVLTPDDYKKESYEWDAIKRKAGLEINVDLSKWVEPMNKELFPLVFQTSQEGSQATADRLGITVPKAVQPKLKEALQKATMNFCEETNKTTSLQLQDALATLKDEMEQGTVQGDGRNEMRRRVQDVFDNAEDSRAYRIAVTEQSRAIHAAQQITAKESGLVKGYKWVLSNDPCEICKEIADSNPEIDLDGIFATVSDNKDYGEVRYPPAHPHCFCSMQEVLKD